MAEGTRGNAPKLARVFLADPVGDAARLVQSHAARLGAEIVVFEQAGLLAMEAARHDTAQLIVIFRPDSFAVLERLRNDGRTRHIPVLLCCAVGHEAERKFQALVASDQVLDYPFEEEILIGWIERALKGRFDRGMEQEFAQARLSEPTTAHFTGRVSWVSGNRVRFETDLVLPEGAEVPLEGPLVAKLGCESLTVRVLSRTRDDVFYNQDVRLELQCLREPGEPPLVAALDAEPRAVAPAKTKVGVISAPGSDISELVAALDPAKFAIRWIPTLERLSVTLGHLRPALLVVDPAHPDLEDAMRSGGVVRAAKELPVLPMTPRPAGKIWTRLGPGCPTLDVPPLEPNAWSELVTAHARPDAGPQDPERRYVRRDHPFSHARIAVPATLAGISEVGCELGLEYALGDQARARIDVPEAGAKLGVQPLYGRVLRATAAKERAKFVWMGVGNEADGKRLRLYVQDTILAKRRKEFEEST